MNRGMTTGQVAVVRGAVARDYLAGAVLPFVGGEAVSFLFLFVGYLRHADSCRQNF